MLYQSASFNRQGLAGGIVTKVFKNIQRGNDYKFVKY